MKGQCQERGRSRHLNEPTLKLQPPQTATQVSKLALSRRPYRCMQHGAVQQCSTFAPTATPGVRVRPPPNLACFQWFSPLHS